MRRTPATAATALSGLLAVAGCSPLEPAHWAEGGATLQPGPALWMRPGLPTLELRANGDVFVNGELQYSVDRQGRVSDASADPYALLTGEGYAFTYDNSYAGRIGLHNASPPWSEVAWLHLDDAGEVLWFDDDGRANKAGHWSGCDGPALRACTLVTHLVLLESAQNSATWFLQPNPWGPYLPYSSYGVGVEVGIGRRGSLAEP